MDSFSGRVVRGFGRGKQLGFPTANLDTPTIDASDGVYAGTATLQGRTFDMVCSVGRNSTFADVTQPTIEVHLLQEMDDFYGEMMHVELKHFLRPMHKFSTVDDLVVAIEDDIQNARVHLIK